MRARAFRQVDVFGERPYLGNPLAVVLDGEGLADATMQRFAGWTHLSETTFLLPPTDPAADYRVRIFTPGGELPFAGHPTLGSCHAWLQAGGRPKAPGRIVQQCAGGLVAVRREAGERLAFAAPPLRRHAPGPALLARVAQALGLSAAQVVAAQLLDNGPVWLGLLLVDADAVLALRPDHRALRELGHKVGVAGIPAARAAALRQQRLVAPPHGADSAGSGAPPPPAATEAEATPWLISRSNREARAFAGAAARAATPRHVEAPDARHDGALPDLDLEVRAFAASIGIEEDPVTGSLNASLAQWLIAEGHLPERYRAAQGRCLGGDGRVEIECDAAEQVWVGGATVSCVSGVVTL